MKIRSFETFQDAFSYIREKGRPEKVEILGEGIWKLFPSGHTKKMREEMKLYHVDYVTKDAIKAVVVDAESHDKAKEKVERLIPGATVYQTIEEKGDNDVRALR